MAFPVNSRSTGYLVPATTWNADIVDNLNALNTDVIAAEAAIVTLTPLSGNWTPAFGGSTSESGQAYSLQQGSYVRIGNIVFCWGALTLSAEGSIVGNLRIKGLPFTVANLAGQESVFSVRFFNLVSNFQTVYMRPEPDQEYGYIVGMTSSGTTNGVTLTASDIGDTTSMRVHLTYLTT